MINLWSHNMQRSSGSAYRLVTLALVMMLFIGVLLPVSNIANPVLAQQPDLTKRPVKPGTAVLTNTWVRGVRTNEVQGKTTFTKITISAPEIMNFEWGTKAVASEEGLWRLVRIGASPNQETLLASGVSQPGSGGAFSIDLRQYLPAHAPNPAIKYHMQVIPRTKAKSDKSTTTSAGKAGAKVPARTIGSWCPPVVITYARTPDTVFEFPEIYRQAKLVLDEFRVVQDQIGSGEEEYHIAGFMQELFWSPDGGGKFNRPGRQIKIGPFYKVMNPPMTTSFINGPYDPAKKSWSLVLNTQEDQWPRRFAVLVSVMEQDGGGEIGDWKKGFNAVQAAAKTSPILNMSKDRLVGYIREHGFDGVNFFLDVADAFVAIVTKSAVIAGPVLLIGTFVVLTGVAIWAIWEDSRDDYYGTATGAVTLPSNLVSEVHKLPGTLKGSGKYTTYVLKPQTLQFKGPPGATQAASFDGVVEFKYHWEFSDRALN
jgi:hypothetical protein